MKTNKSQNILAQDALWTRSKVNKLRSNTSTVASPWKCSYCCDKGIIVIISVSVSQPSKIQFCPICQPKIMIDPVGVKP